MKEEAGERARKRERKSVCVTWKEKEEEDLQCILSSVLTIHYCTLDHM